MIPVEKLNASLQKKSGCKAWNILRNFQLAAIQIMQQTNIKLVQKLELNYYKQALPNSINEKLQAQSNIRKISKLSMTEPVPNSP